MFIEFLANRNLMYEYKGRYYKLITTVGIYQPNVKYLLKEYKKILFFYIRTKSRTFWVDYWEFDKYKRCK